MFASAKGTQKPFSKGLYKFCGTLKIPHTVRKDLGA